jgi:alpha-N-arabinofuranosidase
MHFNAFIRHAQMVKMANIAQIVNVIAPIFTNPDGLFLQTIFHPFEVYSRTCGGIALDAFGEGETFSGGDYSGLRTLDVAATLDEEKKSLSVYVVNRSEKDALETTITLDSGQFAGPVQAHVINGPDIRAENSFDHPDTVGVFKTDLRVERKGFVYTFEPHSVTVFVSALE